jgi:hypothetical protein
VPCAALSKNCAAGRPATAIMDFERLKSDVGFPAYYEEEARYRL